MKKQLLCRFYLKIIKVILMIKIIFFVILSILVIHIFYKYCIYKSMLSLGKYDFPIDISFNELYKWDKLYKENYSMYFWRKKSLHK